MYVCSKCEETWLHIFSQMIMSKRKKKKKNLRHNNSIIEVHKPVKLQLQQSQLLGLQSHQLEALHLLLFHC